MQGSDRGPFPGSRRLPDVDGSGFLSRWADRPAGGGRGLLRGSFPHRKRSRRKAPFPRRRGPDRGSRRMTPRVLVVRSGANPFLSLAGSSRIEIVEKVSHSIEPVEPDARELEAPAGLAIFTSQVAVERLLRAPRLATLFQKAVSGGRIVAVGTATHEALDAKGVKTDVVAGGSAHSVLECLPNDLEGWRVLLPCGEDAS